MLNPNELEDSYAEFMDNLQQWIPDGIITVDLKLLEELDLLNPNELEDSDDDEQFPHYFHVIETDDKVTLFNHQFSVWIVPQVIDEMPTTITLIALMRQDKLHLELAFATSGVYNTPKFVLKILRHYLTEVIDTESVISSMSEK
ncbi:MAG: hypothetical protein P0S94_01185 [Simkaniaceae bacterium]|nr:hypothetical protein [Simkaniaceae bacterium]